MARVERIVLAAVPLFVAFVLLSAIDHDPAPGVTFSNSPFSDEAWRASNARNLVLFGRWTTDDWAMHLVQAPLSAVQAVVFSIAGVGLIQARLISVGAIVAMSAVLLVGLRRPLGTAGAVAAAVGASLSALTSITVVWRCSSRRSSLRFRWRPSPRSASGRERSVAGHSSAASAWPWPSP